MKSWHRGVIDAIGRVAKRRRFQCVKPSRVIFRLKGSRPVYHNPDAILLRRVRGSEGYEAVLVEVESKPSVKAVSGDVFMASLVSRYFASIFPYERPDIDIGSRVRKRRTFRTFADRRVKGRGIGSGRREVRGDRIEKLHFILVVPRGRTARQYYNRYLELFTKSRRGKGFNPFVTCRCVSSTRKSAARTLGAALDRL
ncbi:MAG: hypothetical protein WBW47_07535 [Thermoplasmata archaeon]